VKNTLSTLDKGKGFYDIIYRITMSFCKMLLITQIVITSIVVGGRYIFNFSPAWGEEVILTCMVYLALVSSSMAIRTNAHIRMTALDNYLPKKAVGILDVLGDIVIFAFGLIMTVEGWSYAQGIGSKGYYTSIPTLSKFWLYFPVVIAGVLIVIFEIESICKHAKALIVKEGEAK
jgi:TRAP-type C4-dicarboxylate transport system permease small subunit